MREAEIPIVVQGKVLLDASKAVLRYKSPDSEVVDMELRRALESAHALVRDFKSMDREQLERPRIVLRRDASPIEMPNILITSSTGAEVRRILAQKDGRHTPSSLAEIDQSDISAVEVLKGNACASSSPIPCPLVRITLKAGTEGKYKQR
jgi:hypothetical protein